MRGWVCVCACVIYESPVLIWDMDMANDTMWLARRVPQEEEEAVPELLKLRNPQVIQDSITFPHNENIKEGSILQKKISNAQNRASLMLTKG